MIGVVGIARATSSRWPLLQDARADRHLRRARHQGPKLTIGVDNWIGYFPLCSGEMRKRMRTAGYVLACDDDKADYRDAHAALKRGELQFAVATVDATC